MLTEDGGSLGENLLVGGFFRGAIAQRISTARTPSVGKEKLDTKLRNQPVICLSVDFTHCGSDGIRVGQQQITMTAAAVKQIRTAETTRIQHKVDVILHEQLQKEGTAAECALCAAGGDGINEFLNTGNISGVQKKNVGFAEISVGRLQIIPPIVNPLCQQIFADAGADGSGNFQMVIQRNILALRAIGAGRHGGRAFFQQGKQRIQPFRAIADVR